MAVNAKRFVPTIVRQSHGLQRFMLLLGFAIIAIFLLHRDLRSVARALRLQRRPHRRRRRVRHPAGTVRGALVRHDGRRHRRAVARHLRHPYRGRGHPARGRAVRHHRRTARPGVGLPRWLARPDPRAGHGCALRVPVAAARDRRRDRALRRQQQRVRRHHGGGDLDHRGLHPAVLPGHPQRHDRGQGRALCRLGTRRRRTYAAHPAQAHLLQRLVVAAGHRHAQRVRGDPDPGRPGLPRLRHRAVGRRRVGLRPQQGDARCLVRHLVDRCLPRTRDRADRARRDAGRREPQRHPQPAAAQPWHRHHVGRRGRDRAPVRRGHRRRRSHRSRSVRLPRPPTGGSRSASSRCRSATSRSRSRPTAVRCTPSTG